MIAIGCDHGAIDLKNQLIEHLKKKGYECNDVGTYTTESCDYPVYAWYSFMWNRNWNEYGC